MTKYQITGTEFDHSIGCFSDCPYAGDSEEEIVAIFDTKELAYKYIDDSRLKKPQRHKIFRSSSLLQGCEYAEVEEYHPEPDPPHNPVIK